MNLDIHIVYDVLTSRPQSALPGLPYSLSFSLIPFTLAQICSTPYELAWAPFHPRGAGDDYNYRLEHMTLFLHPFHPEHCLTWQLAPVSRLHPRFQRLLAFTYIRQQHVPLKSLCMSASTNITDFHPSPDQHIRPLSYYIDIFEHPSSL